MLEKDQQSKMQGLDEHGLVQLVLMTCILQGLQRSWSQTLTGSPLPYLLGTQSCLPIKGAWA